MPRATSDFRPGARRRARRHERGQLVIEFILLMPFVLGLFFGAVKVGQIVVTAGIVHYAAFMQTRSTSVHAQPGDAGRRMLERTFTGRSTAQGNRVAHRTNVYVPFLHGRGPAFADVSAEYDLRDEPTLERGDN